MSKLGIYDGIGDPDTFIQEFRITALFKSWTTANQLQHLPIFLKGKALRVFNAITDRDTIDKALKGLREGCKPPNESLLLSFFKRSLGKTELISEYALALQEMLQLAMPQLHETFPQYQAALLRSHLCLSLPKDLESLVNFKADSLSWDQL